jgi:RimJ/RimL family protein N-acetyltransferase
MSDDRRIVSTARGDFALRPERPEDDAFLFRLFRLNTIDVLHLMGLPETEIEKLVGFQYRSQTASYRALFPDACFSIIDFAGETIGRLIEHDEGEVVYFVDFVLLPERQAQGLGTAFIRAIMDEWATRGRGTRVQVLVTNEASRRLCRKLGMVEVELDDQAFIELRWYPPG